jgi:hypothetical protein
MRFNDAIVGLFLSVLAIMVLFHVETFPSLPLHDLGQPLSLAYWLGRCLFAACTSFSTGFGSEPL